MSRVTHNACATRALLIPVAARKLGQRRRRYLYHPHLPPYWHQATTGFAFATDTASDITADEITLLRGPYFAVSWNALKLICARELDAILRLPLFFLRHCFVRWLRTQMNPFDALIQLCSRGFGLVLSERDRMEKKRERKKLCLWVINEEEI